MGMAKELFVESDLIHKIKSLRFEIPTQFDVQQQAHMNVVSNPNLYEKSDGSSLRKPLVNGLLDRRMGPCNKENKCDSCGERIDACLGHFGYIDLQLPVFHVGQFKATIGVLQMICKSCSAILLSDADKALYRRLLANLQEMPTLKKKNLKKKIVELCKKVTLCPHCFEPNGVVKKAGVLKISHEKYRNLKKVDQPVVEKAVASFDDLLTRNKAIDLGACLVDMLNPLDVLRLFERIPDDEVCFLLMNNEYCHPRDLILTRIAVPPNCIRPSVVSELKAGTNEDDLTMQLGEVACVNSAIMMHQDQGMSVDNLAVDWEFLQLTCALYVNGQLTGLSLSHQPKKAVRGLMQRLKGKAGRFRSNLSGKRVDYTARSVISPDPNLRIDEVGVPLRMTKTLTYPSRVTAANMEEMKKLVTNGPHNHPGANYVSNASGKGKRSLEHVRDRKSVANELRKGDIIERHLKDGDIVLFNRQPSLHRQSIMAFRAVVKDQRTLCFNECICTPFNADFDGDEMNLHLPQTEEARAEAWTLMASKFNLVTPRNGDLLIAAIQDFITGSYLLTLKDVFFYRGQVCQLLAAMLSGHELNTQIKLPQPCIIRPVALWSGKQIFSLVIKSNALLDSKPDSKPDIKSDRKKALGMINMRAKGKAYTCNEELCVKDAYLVIRNSEVLAGSIDKSAIGSGSKSNIFYHLLRDYGEEAAIGAMWRMARVSSYFLMNRGFSIGIGDVTPSAALLEKKQDLLDAGSARCDEFIRQLKEKRLPCRPGCNEEESLEAVILGELSKIRDQAGKTCMETLPPSNSALVMCYCGSKGSVINISQMTACVGQQAVSGARVKDGFEDRTLPHFGRHVKTPAAKGFVANSFYSGMTPTEFYFHTIAGREGIVDTAVKTAETGYMQRRMVKGLEDLCSHYDRTVRNSTGKIVQFKYGGDGLDPMHMEADNRPVDFQRTLDHIRATFPDRGAKPIPRGGLVSLFRMYLLTMYGGLLDDLLKLHLEEFLTKLEHRVCDRQLLPVEEQVNRITPEQLSYFMDRCRYKYQHAEVEPGTTVGALAAGSISEPATQMTLKTFHFAGVASMNITQGVPRIKEIINASKKISTPVFRTRMTIEDDADFARLVKGRVEKTTLGQISDYLETVILPDDFFVTVKLDVERVRLLKLEVSTDSIKRRICTGLKIKPGNVQVLGNSVLTVKPEMSKLNIDESLHQLRDKLVALVVQGLTYVNRAVISVDDGKKPATYKLLVEGTGLQEVIATYGVKGTTTTSNDIMETAKVLGIEAARATIVHEIQETMKEHGISIDRRHLELLSDAMCYRGQVFGFTCSSLSQVKESVLMLASFERTCDHLFDAAYFGQEDRIDGVSESIIMGLPMTMGTGMFKLLHRPANQFVLKKRPLIFDQPEYHVTEEDCAGLDESF